MNGRTVRLHVNEQVFDVPASSSVAAALLSLDQPFRRSLDGERRAPLCGMGVCFECRVSIDGVAQQRACQVTVRDGMRIGTDA